MTLNPPKELEILLIESEPAHALGARQALKALEFRNRLKVVDNREAALDYLLQPAAPEKVRLPDLIFLDPAISGRKGWYLFAEIQANPDLKHIPVVILTNSPAESELMENCGINDHFLVKPLNSDSASAMINGIIKKIKDVH